MTDITLWNSVANRRRSISDTFYENGLGTLQGYLAEKGYKVEVIDWARDDFFTLLSPLFLTKILRKIYLVLFEMKPCMFKPILGIISFQLQDILSLIQKKRLKRKIRELVKELKQKRTRILGVKVWYGEAFKNAEYIAAMIKKTAPQILTIAGGYHVTLYENRILEMSDFDLAVVCEGELSLEKILNASIEYKDNWNKAGVLNKITRLAEEGKIENLIYRKGKKIFKTKRQEVKADIFKSIPKYALNENKVSIHVIVESLGCDWGKCNFCVHPYFYPHYSLRDPCQVAAEIEELRKTGIGIFRFAGSDTPPAFGEKIAQRIIDKKLSVIFAMGSRPIKGAKYIFDSLVSSYTVLINAGLRAVFMGGESGEEYVNQTVMNKGVGFEDIVTTIKALREAEKQTEKKVYLSLALIYPVPLLGKVTLNKVKEDNLRLLKQTAPDSVMITPPGPFLHTKWYKEREAFGFKAEDSVIRQAMEYEYVLYKPPQFWPKLGISLEGKSFKKLLYECNKFRESVERELEIPTDISDEHFLMFYSAGIKDKREIFKAKKDTILDIISCDYRFTNTIAQKVNSYSKWISLQKS